MRKLNNFFSRIYRFLWMNVLWIVGLIPLVFLVLSLQVSRSWREIVEIASLVFSLTPILLFPVTGGLFYVTKKENEEPDELIIFKDFIRGVTKNYFIHFRAGLFFGTVWLVIGMATWISFSQRYYMMLPVLLSIFILSFVSGLYYFCNQVYLNETVYICIKNSILLTLLNIKITVCLFILWLAITIVGVSIFPYLIPTFYGAIITFLTYKFYLMNISLVKSYNS